MKILTDETNEKLQTALQSPFFSQLDDLLTTSKEAPTLRQIKAKIDLPKIEKKLDYLIEEQIILRENKRYFFAVSTIEVEDEAFISRAVMSLFEWLATFSREQQMQVIASLYQMIDRKTPIITKVELPLLFVEVNQTDLLAIVHFTTEEKTFSLANYFKTQRTQIGIERFEAVTQLLGDVDPKYYLDQAFVIVDTLRQGRKVRKSIFLESLEQFGLVKLEEAWQLNVPILSEGQKVAIESVPSIYLEATDYQKRQMLYGIVQKLDLINQTMIVLKE